jgi:tetratricopeptide (TPR) repeat protein
LRTNRASATGHYHEAARLADETLLLGERAGQPDATFFHRAALALVEVFRGRPQETMSIIEAFDGYHGYPAFQAALAWSYAELDRCDASHSIIQDLRSNCYAGVPRDHNWLMTLGFLARASARLDDQEVAEELYELLAPYRAELMVAVTFWGGPVAHDLGLLATTLERYDEADGHFAHAAEAQEQIGATGTLIHTRLQWARMLLRRGRHGDSERARSLLEAARKDARNLELTGVEPQIEALLTSLAL